MAADRPHTDAEVDAAVAALTDADRLRRAQDVVARAAPGLQNVLNEALAAGGWFAEHEKQVREAASIEDADDRLRAVRTLLAEETRLGMMVGVAVGYELAHELSTSTPTSEE